MLAQVGCRLCGTEAGWKHLVVMRAGRGMLLQLRVFPRHGVPARCRRGVPAQHAQSARLSCLPASCPGLPASSPACPSAVLTWRRTRPLLQG